MQDADRCEKMTLNGDDIVAVMVLIQYYNNLCSEDKFSRFQYQVKTSYWLHRIEYYIIESSTYINQYTYVNTIYMF